MEVILVSTLILVPPEGEESLATGVFLDIFRGHGLGPDLCTLLGECCHHPTGLRLEDPWGEEEGHLARVAAATLPATRATTQGLLLVSPVL